MVTVTVHNNSNFICRRREIAWFLQEEAVNKLSICLLVAVLVLTGCGGSAQPKPGASFSGSIDIDADKAESARLFFTISEDGTAVTKVGVSFTNFKCGGMSAGEMTSSTTANDPITDGLDISSSSIGQIKGRFNSPTKASGTIHLDMKISTGMGGSISCDLGTWDWSAEAK
jgi:hypothetical protein